MAFGVEYIVVDIVGLVWYLAYKNFLKIRSVIRSLLWWRRDCVPCINLKISMIFSKGLFLLTSGLLCIPLICISLWWWLILSSSAYQQVAKYFYMCWNILEMVYRLSTMFYRSFLSFLSYCIFEFSLRPQTVASRASLSLRTLLMMNGIVCSQNC